MRRWNEDLDDHKMKDVGGSMKTMVQEFGSWIKQNFLLA
jgi:hypothetical protein